MLAQAGSGQSRFGYTGEQVDPTGLVYLRARYYTPGVGRFLTADSIIPDPFQSQSFNRYTYVYNNPIRYQDPTGHCVEPISGAVCIAIGQLVVDAIAVGIAAYLIYDTGRDIAETLETFPGRAPELPPLPGTNLEEITPCHQDVGADNRVPAFELPPFPVPAGPTIENVFHGDTFERPEVPTIYQATHKHHIFPQQFRDWFAARGIDIDDYTVTIDSTTHLRGIHGKGLGDLPGQWNARWAQFISTNPQASQAQIRQFASELMRDFGLDDLSIEPYR